MTMNGNGTTNSVFAVSNVQMNGNGTISIDYAGYSNAKSNQVFLVE